MSKKIYDCKIIYKKNTQIPDRANHLKLTLYNIS